MLPYFSNMAYLCALEIPRLSHLQSFIHAIISAWNAPFSSFLIYQSLTHWGLVLRPPVEDFPTPPPPSWDESFLSPALISLSVEWVFYNTSVFYSKLWLLEDPKQVGFTWAGCIGSQCEHLTYVYWMNKINIKCHFPFSLFLSDIQRHSTSRVSSCLQSVPLFLQTFHKG